MKMSKGKVKSPKCECCGRTEFKHSPLDFGSINDGKLNDFIEIKRLCKPCEKAIESNVKPIGYFTNTPSRKIYPLDSLKHTGMVERLIKEELSNESKEFIRSFHKNKILRLFGDEYSLEAFVKWIESIEKKIDKIHTTRKRKGA